MSSIREVACVCVCVCVCERERESLPALVKAYTATSVLERHAHLLLEKSEPTYQKIDHLLLTIQHTKEHLLTVHCTAQR